MEKVRRFINWLYNMKDFFLMIIVVCGFLALVAVKLGHYQNSKVIEKPKIEYNIRLLKAALRHHHCRHCKVYHDNVNSIYWN